MTVSEIFRSFLENLRINNLGTISNRYGEITSALNQKFRDSDSKTSNTLQVGSFGRKTGINGISDLDMLYVMPSNLWNKYKDNQSSLLKDVKDAISNRYPNTDVRVDRLVVTVTYNDFHIETQPVFEDTDDNNNRVFKFPDTYDGGSWKVTKPLQEMDAFKELNDAKNQNLRKLCKMIRAWRNKHGVQMGGLLIDTLAYNFLNSTNKYDSKSYAYFGELVEDFFSFLIKEGEKSFYLTPGSNQRVYVKTSFQRKSKKAYDLAIEANKSNSTKASKKWKEIFGRSFPSIKSSNESKATIRFHNTEEFIEDYYPIRIHHQVKIDCEVHQEKQFKKSLLSMLKQGFGISSNRKLIFKIIELSIPPQEDYIVKWKVLNRGSEAENRNSIRGDIIDPNLNHNSRKETADFSGEHIVECYIIQNNSVVAIDSINVPIL